MGRAIRPRKVMATLDELRVGKACPHEQHCACRTGNWCPQAKGKTGDRRRDYPMMHLEGCSFAYDRCCCRVLDEIETLAAEYLDRSGVNGPPVPLEVLNLFDSRRAIEVRYLPMRRYLGCTWFVDGEWVVQLNEAVPHEVRHFTAFHEGFHILCGSSGLSFRRAAGGYQAVSERLADYFAASILMPRAFVHRMWPALRSPDRMAGMFDVPVPVMKDWLARLHIPPV